MRISNILPKTEGQRAYLDAIDNHTLVFVDGPAGTGKTFLATVKAAEFLKKGIVSRIVMTRPAVEAGEKLGFLPGTMEEKIDPYLRPLFDALESMFSVEEIAMLQKTRRIEVVPIAFMRGRTLRDTFVVLDEAQNTTVVQMKMFLTRIGENSRVVVAGDSTQHDIGIRYSGFIDALERLNAIKDIAIVRLSREDIVRSDLVMEIVKAYDG